MALKLHIETAEDRYLSVENCVTEIISRDFSRPGPRVPYQELPSLWCWCCCPVQKPVSKLLKAEKAKPPLTYMLPNKYSRVTDVALMMESIFTELQVTLMSSTSLYPTEWSEVRGIATG